SDFGALHSHDRALQEDVFSTGQVRMESRSHLDERPDASADRRGSGCGPQNPCQQLQCGRLACTVGSNDPECFARADLERYVAKGPAITSRCGTVVTAHNPPCEERQQVAQAVMALSESELLPDGVKNDRGLHRVSEELGQFRVQDAIGVTTHIENAM